MNRLNRTRRLIATAAAVTVTSVQFAAVVSLAEPLRSTLIAKNAAGQVRLAAAAALRLADAR
jgi:hypothetical protein